MSDTTVLLNYGVLFVDEFRYLGNRRFDHLMTSRKSIDGMCKIILAGDFSQLEPPDNSKSCESNRFWSHSILVVPIKDTCKMLVVTYAVPESVSKCSERILDQEF